MKPILEKLIHDAAAIGNPSPDPYYQRNMQPAKSVRGWIDSGIPAADKFIRSSSAKWLYDNNSGLGDGMPTANYDEDDDTIHMIVPEAFPSPEAYVGAALHELVHWTGKKGREGRFGEAGNLADEMSKPNRAVEEMTAEMGAVLLEVELAIPIDKLWQGSVDYIANWETWKPGLELFGFWLDDLVVDDKAPDTSNYAQKAASTAEKAVDYLLTRVNSGEKK